MLAKRIDRNRVVNNGAEDSKYSLSVRKHSLHLSAAVWEMRPPQTLRTTVIGGQSLKVVNAAKYESASPERFNL